jgi:molybdopterin molybdotransferase
MATQCATRTCRRRRDRCAWRANSSPAATLGLRVDPATCIRITTGAPLPEGATPWSIREVVRVEGDRVVIPHASAKARTSAAAGEDVRVGDAVSTLASCSRHARRDRALARLRSARRRATPDRRGVHHRRRTRPAGHAAGPGEIHDSNASC